MVPLITSQGLLPVFQAKECYQKIEEINPKLKAQVKGEEVPAAKLHLNLVFLCASLGCPPCLLCPSQGHTQSCLSCTAQPSVSRPALLSLPLCPCSDSFLSSLPSSNVFLECPKLLNVLGSVFRSYITSKQSLLAGESELFSCSILKHILERKKQRGWAGARERCRGEEPLVLLCRSLGCCSVHFSLLVLIEHLNQVTLREKADLQEKEAQESLDSGKNTAVTTKNLLETLSKPGQTPLFYAGGIEILTEMMADCKLDTSRV
jgi:hypothetical protein